VSLRLVILGVLVMMTDASADSRPGALPLDVSTPDYRIPGPGSELLIFNEWQIDREFCAEWNPDFSFKGNLCCGKPGWKYRRRGIKCTPKRAKRSFCDEMTAEQIAYVRKVKTGKVKDVMSLLIQEVGVYGEQAQCKPSDGFLSWGRPVLPSSKNRIRLRRPHRCVNFGTDPMVGMLEWVGRKVNEKYPIGYYPGTSFLVGDVSAPRGGCLAGKGGKRGHVSHTNGRDVDLGFLAPSKSSRTPAGFSRRFNGEANWWLIKEIFNNPFACVKRVFLDRRHIRKLRKAARGDPDWARLSRHIRHVRYHRDHYHVRIGEAPGTPGCSSVFDKGYLSRITSRDQKLARKRRVAD